MAEVIGAVGVALPLFASTNTDDLVILLAFFASGRYRTAQVVAGQMLGMAVLVGVSLALSQAAGLAVPEAWIGLLGLAPIAIGAVKLWGLVRGDADAATASAGELPEESRGWHGRSQMLTVAGVRVANGGDNIGVYVPVFAVMGAGEVLAVSLMFAALTGVLCGVAYALVNNALVGRRIQAVGERALPFVLIGVGVLVLWEAGTAELLR